MNGRYKKWYNLIKSLKGPIKNDKKNAEQIPQLVD
jgi:hypothetical protein